MIRFDPYSGKFVLQAHCRVSYDMVCEGQEISEVAEGLGEVYLSAQQVAELGAIKTRACSTWAHPDGRLVTIASRGEDWQVAWHGTGHPRAVRQELSVTGSDYRAFVSRLRSSGFKPMPLAVHPPAAPSGRY